MSQTVNFPGPFDEEGRLVCFRCFGPTIHRPSGQPGTLGRVFYKCENKPGIQCERFFKWQEDVDKLRIAHGVPDPEPQPASAPTTMVASAPSTPARSSTQQPSQSTSSQPSGSQPQPSGSQATNSQPSGSQATSSQPSGSQATSSQPVPGRTRVRPDIKLNATPVITPQRHLSRKGTAETVVPATAAPAPATPSRRPAPSPSPPPQVKDEDDEVIVETVDDGYTNVTLLRTPRPTGRIYPALPSTQGSSPDNDGSPVARKRPRSHMPGAFTDSTDSSSPTATGRNREIREWQIQSSVAVSPMADRSRGVFSSPPPTQDTAPATMSSPLPMPPPPSTPSRASASTASRMHGLLASSSPAPTQATIRMSEPGSPSTGTTEDIANRLVQDAMLLSRRSKAAEASAKYKASYIKELEDEKQKLLDERAAMQADHARAIQEMQKKLTQAYEDISKLQKKLSSR